MRKKFPWKYFCIFEIIGRMIVGKLAGKVFLPSFARSLYNYVSLGDIYGYGVFGGKRKDASTRRKYRDSLENAIVLTTVEHVIVSEWPRRKKNVKEERKVVSLRIVQRS